MLKCVNYLVTTRGVELPAKEFFEEYSWEILGQKEFAQRWPDSIKALRKPFKCNQSFGGKKYC